MNQLELADDPCFATGESRAATRRERVAPQRPAPLPGQDTREICRKPLGMSAVQTGRLIADRLLFAPAGSA